MNVLTLAYNAYIPWDVNLFYAGMVDLREKMGTAINIGFWIFIIVTGIYLIIKIVNSLGS